MIFHQIGHCFIKFASIAHTDESVSSFLGVRANRTSSPYEVFVLSSCLFVEKVVAINFITKFTLSKEKAPVLGANSCVLSHNKAVFSLNEISKWICLPILIHLRNTPKFCVTLVIFYVTLVLFYVTSIKICVT